MKEQTVFEILKTEIIGIFEKKGYINVTVQIENGSNKGDGYIALMYRVNIMGDVNGKKEEIKAMVKFAPNDTNVRKYMSTTKMFNREIFYYNNIVPKYEELQKELAISDKMKCMFAKCFANSDKYYNEFIVLEDLNTKGYEMIRKTEVDYDHAKVGVQTLAKLHALSFIFKDQYPEEFSKIVAQLDDPFLKSNGEFDCTGIFDYGDKSLNKFLNCIDNEEHKNRLKKVINTRLMEKLRFMWGSGKKRIITHGDFWANNILFQYQGDIPIKALPIDFQISRYASIANDFSYFIGMSSQSELRRNHYWKLVDDYYNSFSDFLSECGYDANRFCNYLEFKTELKIQSTFGLTMCVMALPIFTAKEPYEIHKLYSGNIPDDEFYGSSDEYKTRANDIITDFIEFGYI